MGIESSDEMADFLEHQYLTYGEKKDGAIILSKLRDLVTTRNYQKKISKKPDF